MKLSIYTFCYSINSKYYIYNTLSNALLELDFDTYLILSGASKDKDIDEKTIDSDLLGVLKNKYFITDNYLDDFLLYKSIVMPLRAQRNFMHLTIAPTMECNFNCFYCFETEKPKGTMSSDVMDSIVKYIESIPELQKIYLTWFGGEPLMATEQMVLFYDKLSTKFTKEFSSNIITTGYYLTESVISILQKLKIESVQITLDGNKDRHNKIKKTPDCDDVFSKVLNNIDLLTNKAPEIEVIFRVNITRLNFAEYASLYKYLAQRYMNKNVSVSPGFVQDRTHNHKTGTFCLKRDEISRFILDLWYKHSIYTPWLRYPHDGCQECAIRDNMAISFDAEGNAYKCWEMIGRRQYAIGKLDGSGKITNINRVLLNRQLYGADPLESVECKSCAYLPICEGGCPIQRIQNQFEDGVNDVCSVFKDHLSEFMEVHLSLKDAGYENR